MWTLRKVPLTELSAHAELTLQGVDTQRLTMVLKLLAGTLRRQCYRDLWLLQMVHGHDATDVHSPLGDGSQHRFVEDTLSAMESIKAIGLLAVRSSTDSASLLAFGPQLVPPIQCSTTHETLGGRESRWRGAVELFAEFSRMLAAEGIAFLQAMRPGDEDAPLLIRLGFEELARLDYLVAAAELRGGEGDGGIAGPPGSRLIPYPQWADQQRNLQHDPKERLIDLINRTYEGSLDCPRFASYRSTTQVVDGYLSHPQAAPELWRIALDQAERPFTANMALVNSSMRRFGVMQRRRRISTFKGRPRKLKKQKFACSFCLTGPLLAFPHTVSQSP